MNPDIVEDNWKQSKGTESDLFLIDRETSGSPVCQGGHTPMASNVMKASAAAGSVTPGENAGYSYSHGGHECPRCKGSAYRVRRQYLDFLVSIVVPVRRYRCRSMGCGWEGILRTKRHSGERGDRPEKRIYYL
jgi:hypothetical protein